MSHPLRQALVYTVVLAGVGVLIALGVSAYYAIQIEEVALKVHAESLQPDLQVVDLRGGLIELRRVADSGGFDETGLVGLEGLSGYGQVGKVVDSSGNSVTREFFPFSGSFSPGDLVRLDQYAYPTDPLTAHGLSFEGVMIPSALGPLPSWLTAGRGDTWVILVHGEGGGRREMLRALKIVGRLGLPALLISVRNDAGAPGDPSGYHQFGLTEWADLEAAAEYAVAHQARRLVIIGNSMGGASAVSFLYRSSLADRVSGVVLDAPMLDFGQTVDLAAAQRNVPGFVAAIAKGIAAAWYDVDWQGLDYLSRASRIAVPVLVFHGDRDRTVPLQVSEQLARARPDLVRLVIIPGADHVASWNVQPARYEDELQSFLLSIVEDTVEIDRGTPLIHLGAPLVSRQRANGISSTHDPSHAAGESDQTRRSQEFHQS